MGVRNLRTDYGRGKGEEGEYSWIAGAPQSEELLKTLEELDLEGERDDELDLCLFHVWRGEGLQSELQTPGLALDPPAGALYCSPDPQSRAWHTDWCLFLSEKAGS